MMPISKGEPPRALADARRRIRQTPDTLLSWENLDRHERKMVLRSLLDEQGCLCAYCMRKITEESAHVEHWIPQSVGAGCDDPDSVDYGNLLAVCDGFEGNREGLTCDRARGNVPLTVNPLRPETLDSIRYQRDGRIRSDCPAIEHDLNDTLNLNQRLLMRNRREAVRELEKMLKRRAEGHGNQSVKSFCRCYIDDHMAHPELREPYDGIIMHFMRKRLRAAG